MKKYELILDVFRNMEDDEIAYIWNEYCQLSQHYDNEIMSGYDFEEYARNTDPINLLNRMFFGSDDYNKESSANPNRNYFVFNGYANIVSFDYIYNNYSDEFNHVDIDNLINYIIENDENFSNSDIEEILESGENNEN